MLFVLTISIFSVFLLMFGTSYAYYVSDEGPNLNITTGDFNANVAVVFNQSQYINFDTGIPITLEEVAEKANKAVFTLVSDSSVLSGYEVAVTISLVDIYIDEELRVDDFRYNLSCSDGTDSFSLTSVDYGTGADFTDEVVEAGTILLGTISTNDNFDVNKVYTCTLSMYLFETEENQNSLMDKNFSARIKVDSVFRK